MVTNMLYGGPFRDMRLLQEEVNRLAQSAAAPQATFPAINVYAHQDGIVITAELPGVQQDDLEITVHRDTVTLRGERQDKSDDAGAYHRRAGRAAEASVRAIRGASSRWCSRSRWDRPASSGPTLTIVGARPPVKA